MTTEDERSQDGEPMSATPAPSELTLADALVAELVAEGVPVGQGEFSLDRERAKEKLRRFQLPDPYGYAVELVAAAVVKGAQEVVVAADADDLRLSFDGRPFDREDLLGLYDALLSAGDAGAALEARRLLAVAVNAALSLSPRFVRIESGDGQRGAWLEAHPDGPDDLGEADGLGPGTRVHVKLPLRPRLVKRLVKDVAHRLPEERALRAHCAWCEVPVLLEGERISGGLGLPGIQCPAALDTPRARGLVGFRPEASGREVRILQHGVWVTTHALAVSQARPAGFVALVEAPQLHKDLSQRDVVKDAAYRAFLDDVEEGFARSVRSAALRGDGSEPYANRLPLAPEAAEALRRASCWEIATRPEADLLTIGQSPAAEPCAVTSDGQVLGRSPEGGWRPLPLPGGLGRITAACVDAEGALALGDEQGVLHHRRGGLWEQHPVQGLARLVGGGVPARLHAFWARGSGDLTAVGDHGLILHFDGETWAAQPSGVGSRLRALFGLPGGPLFAAGHGGTILCQDPPGRGSPWRLHRRGHPDERLAALWGCAPDLLFAAGRRYRHAPDDGARFVSEPLLLCFDGARWRSEPVPGHGLPLEQVFAAGMEDASPEPPDLGALRALWGTGPGFALSSGNRGQLLRFDGEVWQPMDSGTGLDLTGLWGTSPADVVAVGAAGTMLHFDGRAFRPVLPFLVKRLVSLEELAALSRDSARVVLLASGSREVAAEELGGRGGDRSLCLFSPLEAPDLGRLCRILGRRSIPVR